MKHQAAAVNRPMAKENPDGLFRACLQELRSLPMELVSRLRAKTANQVEQEAGVLFTMEQMSTSRTESLHRIQRRLSCI